MALIGAAVITSTWFYCGDPLGINNMYVALLSPAIIMLLDKILISPFVKSNQKTDA